MSALVLLTDAEIERQTARDIARSLERLERFRGSTVERARARVARRLGIGPGTFENVVRGRIKRVDSWVRARLQGLLVRELEADIARLSHELELARQGGVALDSHQICEIEAHLIAARSLLDEAAR